MNADAVSLESQPGGSSQLTLEAAPGPGSHSINFSFR